MSLFPASFWDYGIYYVVFQFVNQCDYLPPFGLGGIDEDAGIPDIFVWADYSPEHPTIFTGDGDIPISRMRKYYLHFTCLLSCLFAPGLCISSQRGAFVVSWAFCGFLGSFFRLSGE